MALAGCSLFALHAVHATQDDWCCRRAKSPAFSTANSLSRSRPRPGIALLRRRRRWIRGAFTSDLHVLSPRSVAFRSTRVGRELPLALAGAAMHPGRRVAVFRTDRRE